MIGARNIRLADVMGLLVASGACLLLLAGCGSVPAPAPIPSPPGEQSTPTAGALPLTGEPRTPVVSPVVQVSDLDDEQRVAIYSSVVAALLDQEKPPYVYISPYLGQGERLDIPDESLSMSEELVVQLESAGVGPTFQLLDFAEAIGDLEDGGAVKNDGVFITLGALEPGPGEGTVQVRGSIYRRVGSAEGYRFILGLDPASGWQVHSTEREWTDEGPESESPTP